MQGRCLMYKLHVAGWQPLLIKLQMNRADSRLQAQPSG
jgi:hypothetical protein